MRIYVGSQNPAKLAAVTSAVDAVALFIQPEVVGVEVSSGVSSHPHSMEETILGAKNRATAAYPTSPGALMSVGLESGLMPAPGSKTGFFDFTVCVLYDGNDFYFGTSSGFEYPSAITKMILEDGIEASTAARMLGITQKEKLGTQEGIIGLLTDGRWNRTSLTAQAVSVALSQYVHRDWYVI